MSSLLTFQRIPKVSPMYRDAEPSLIASDSYGIVEYTPQAYLPADLDKFFANFSRSQVGDRPVLESIDGGYLQTQVESFNYNGESVSLTLLICCHVLK